jgi:hypothetical protein
MSPKEKECGTFGKLIHTAKSHLEDTVDAAFY